MPTRSTTATRRSRSATSTRSTSTPRDREMIERTLLAMADGVAGRLRSAGVRAGTIAVKIRDSVVPDDHPPADARRADRHDRADLSRSRSSWPGRRSAASASGCSASRRRTWASASSSRCSSADDPKRRRAIEAADAVRRRYGDDAVTRARLLGAGLPAPFERDPRNPLDRRARGGRRSRWPADCRTRPTVVTPKLTRTSTTFRSDDA